MRAQTPAVSAAANGVMVPAGGSYRQKGPMPLQDGPAGGSAVGGQLVPAGTGALQDPAKSAADAGGPRVTIRDERAEVRAENLLECRKMCVFFTFLAVFTTAMLLEQTPSSARLADRIQNRLDGGPVPLESISQTSEVYEYLSKVIVPALYENSTDTNLALDLSTYLHPFDMYNRMVGGVQVRQSRVRNMPGCQMSPLFSEYTINCYPNFGADSEDTAAFGPDLVFTWQPGEGGSSYEGLYSTYTPGGYIEVLPTDVDAALAKIEEMKSGNFLGPWTRAVFIDFVIWSSNVGAYAVVTVNIEFAANSETEAYTGVLTMSSRSLGPSEYAGALDWLAFVFVIIVILFVIYFMVEEIAEIREGGMSYFFDGWNVLDWVNMILLLASFGLRCYIFSTATELDIGKAQITDRDLVPSLKGFAQAVESVKLINAVNCFLLWGKCAKHLRYIPVIKDLIRTVWAALDLFMPFLFMLAIACVGFAMAYNIGFGGMIIELATLGRSVVYLCRAYMRDVTLIKAYYKMPEFGAFLILTFYVAFLLVGVNVLFAILAHAMFVAKEDTKKKKDEDDHQDEPVEEFMREVKKRTRRFIKRRSPKLYKMIYRRRKKKKVFEEEQPAEQKDGAAEIVLADDSDDESYNEFDDEADGLPTKADLMRAIDQMSGRVLSEVSIVGIEIRSELHDVCERVAQMMMAVEELSMRADAVRMDQEEYLEMNG